METCFFFTLFPVVREGFKERERETEEKVSGGKRGGFSEIDWPSEGGGAKMIIAQKNGNPD